MFAEQFDEHVKFGVTHGPKSVWEVYLFMFNDVAVS